ncbi:Eco57I restriction-modification methylase domain-containing protein [Actinocorallia sp. A-T 12471]|uniref:Eco57I restriction-modification methylase domain-containing protein n=1 Tax=Actinocorallia sp. A-T 12471 TaxID=3089813 RepID=UPI0029D0D113|nr:Eco57I restriction-modification methylase domain-containing protein [Actinocorallia sp. A-T 12471]MDX6738151.1 Eco57I restriction-modification methylase domain-containing protein [Actinocorallia sp. A-T 12471]
MTAEEPATTCEVAGRLVDRTEARRQQSSAGLDPDRRASLGQYFTPSQVADFIAALANLPELGCIRVLDPGAGAGSLSASIVARLIKERPHASVTLVACELDESLHPVLADTLRDCRESAAKAGVKVETVLQPGSFIDWAAGGSLLDTAPEPFDLVVTNPPYKKLRKNASERSVVASHASDVSNLYTAFLAMSVNLLKPGGQLVAITPRSFANGPYFRSFRQFLLDRMHLDRLHVFESRSTVFGDADVLQENVIFSATRTASIERGPLTISTSAGYDDVPRVRTAPYTEVVHPSDPEQFIHISGDDGDRETAAMLARLPAQLVDLGLKVSTGRVVDFRAKEHLRMDPEPGTVPLIYPLHMRGGRIIWPVPGARKPNAIVSTEATSKLMFPSGNYAVVKRMSSKEEPRRVVASVFESEDYPGMEIGFENHVNVFHANGVGMPVDLARGLCLWLNSTVLDGFIRRFNGHTQINATDLRNLRYPSVAELTALGSSLGGGSWPDQEKIDNLVLQHVSACQTQEGDDTTA